jgi:phosphatidyl-myo-inositol dimannoside synthase
VKVLYVTTAYARHPGDVITPWLGETIKRLRVTGMDVEVLAPSYRGLQSGVMDGVPVHRFRYAPRRFEDLSHDQTVPDRLRERPAYLLLVPFYVAAGMLAAFRLARRHRYDVVHVHWPLPHALFGLAARWAAGSALVCSFHGVELTWTRRRWPVLLPLLRRLIRTSDAVTANSSYTAGMIREVLDRPVDIIPFGSALEPPVEAAGAGASAAAGAGASGSQAFRLLFVGRLVERKGVTYLLDALVRLPAPQPVTLEVVGDGSERAALEARAEQLGLAERVAFHGFVPDAELARLYAACDALVLPAVVDAKGDTEGLGVVLIETLAHGKPVIASDVGGIPDVVKDHATGLLVPPGDADALGGAILELAGHPALARELGSRGRELVHAGYSWPVVIAKLTDLYRRVTAGRVRQATSPAAGADALSRGASPGAEPR